MKFIVAFICVFMGSGLHAHTAIDELKSINLILSQDLEPFQTQTYCDQAEDLLCGKTSRISSTSYATKDERLVVLETLFKEKNKDYEYSLDRCAQQFEKPLKKYEVSHLVALSFMKSVVLDIFANHSTYKSHESFLSFIFENRHTIFNRFNKGFFSNYFQEAKELIHSYTKNHMRILFPTGMYSLIPSYINNNIIEKESYAYSAIKKPDTEDDYALAIALNENTQEYISIEEKPETGDDYALAKALEEEGELSNFFNGIEDDYDLALKLQEEFNGVPTLYPLKTFILPEDRVLFQKISGDYRRIAYDSNVHGMTQSFCRPYYVSIKSLEKKYLGITDNQDLLPSFDTYRQRIEQVVRAHPETFAMRQDAITTALNNIQTYWGHPVDGETGQSLVEVFQHTYWMAQAFGDDYLFLLLEKLAENKETGGGCHPGITGRLIALYFYMLAIVLEKY